MSKKTTDPASPLYQADITGVGFLPSDSMIDDSIGSVPATMDYAQTDPQVDAGTDMVVPAPLPGSIATHIEPTESDYNTLSDHRYTMLGDD
ncbi:Mycobacterium numidiamassiliense ORFan [Mycobacterium numidiamassiliense]|uniref:Mycobacterium numidiamassiliense ORFan n=1 Tax=Mycobacterium numidiamassiliense TaxID=1841861 RepID=A0A2U3PHX2_9MYCO|nr:hypothetical protein [Mycobacterium numidiamassiliense]SPM43343.1 Mycobacterium numidiamassiliense ORFan [Mycobacterium numidiamassiliense]